MEQVLNMLKISVIVSCVVLALILLKPVLHRRYHAKWKYYVWLILAAVLLIPLSPLGWQLSEATEEYAPIQIEVPTVDRHVEAMEGTVTGPAQPMTPPASSVVPVQPQAPAATAPVVKERAERSMEEIAVLIWIAGMAAFAVYYGVGTAVFYRRALRWSCEADEAVAARAAELMEEMGIRRRVPVLVSGEITSPMMIGFFRPKLLLSAGDYKAQELDFILRHELTHYKRHDLWYKLALLTANCVHWFNPFAWLLVREAAVDMELTCDDAVVAGGDTALRRAYSETLLAALHRQSGLNVALSTHFYGGKETMKERFRNILGGGRRRKGVVVLCVVLVVTVAAACLIGFSMPEDEQKDEPNGEPLTAEEVAQWQEKLNSAEYIGFMTHMYSEAKYIRLAEVLYNGAGLTHTPDQAEVQTYLTAAGLEELYTDLEAISAPELEAYVQEKIGLGLDEFAAPLGWTYVEEYDSYYFMHGDTNATSVEVVSGEQLENAVTLEIRSSGGMTEDGILTIVDDKIVSFTNPLYTAVEAIALEQVQDANGEQVDRAWLEWLWPGLSVEGEEGTYSVWYVGVCNQLKEGVPRPEMAFDGNVHYAGQILVRIDGDGIVHPLESEYGIGDDIPQHTYMDLTAEEYILYKYEYDLELSPRQSGWPELSSQLVYSVHAGTERWTQEPEEVARGWCLSWGDELAEYEVLKNWTPGSQRAESDMLVRVVTKQARTAMLLLSQVKTDFEDVTYWEVLGYRLLDGPALPEERVGQDWRSTSATLSITLEGMEEQVPVYLFSGGGDYGIREWSMYIPYENWSCNYLTNRWCPNPNDMALSIQVLEHGENYSFDAFYRSYAQQFDEVWTNADQIALGANVAHAVGYQNTAGGRYTESQLFFGNGKYYEVMWTYSQEQAEGWGERLGWTAATFGIIGDNTSYETGEVTAVGEEEAERAYYLTQMDDEGYVPAGGYLILPENDMAFRLERFLGVESGVREIVGQYSYLDSDGNGVEVLSTVLEGETYYLGIAHDGAVVTATVLVKASDVQALDVRVLGGTIRGMLDRGENVTVWDTHPAIFFDPATGELTAIHSDPNQIA